MPEADVEFNARMPASLTSYQRGSVHSSSGVRWNSLERFIRIQRGF